MSLRPRAHWWGASLTCLLLAVLHTWPLATAPHRLARHDNADVMLNEWIIAWVQHQLPRDPLRLFEANIFYPAHDTLALSEPLIVPALLGAPVRSLGGSPVLVHNVLVIAGLALTALAAYALIHAWTGDQLASLVGASAFAFNAHLLLRTTHLQALHAYGLPLALLAADRLVISQRARDAGWLAFWLIVLAYTSVYFAIFAIVASVIAILARYRDWVGRWRIALPCFGVAAVLSGVVVMPLAVPYRRVAIEQGMVRSLDNVRDFSTTVGAYLTPGGRFSELESFFPGIAVLLLSIAAVVLVWRGETTDTPARRRVMMLAAIGLAGFVLSLGTNTPIYGWLYNVFPPLSGIRVAARFAILFLLAVAVLAGMGASRLRRSGAFGRWSTGAMIAGLVVVNAEAMRAPFEYRSFEGIPNLYSILAREPGRVVLVEQPFYPPEGIFENAEYVLNSTAHWRPLMNGYSGFIPQSYREYAKTFWFFPREHAIDAMRRAGVSHVIVHAKRFGADAADVEEALQKSPYFERIAVGSQGIALYRLH
ncbi:MAG: hypothetical protein WBC51_26000 [Vicinamibacterales bacterium]